MKLLLYWQPPLIFRSNRSVELSARSYLGLMYKLILYHFTKLYFSSYLKNAI